MVSGWTEEHGLIKFKIMKRIFFLLSLFIAIGVSAQDIGNISNGESGSSVRGKLNQTIDTTNRHNDTINKYKGDFVNISGNTTHRTSDGSDHSDVVTNTAKVTNATHTGEVTGATALTIADDVIEAANMESTNSPTDNYVWSYDLSSGGGTWVENAGGGGSGDVSFTDTTGVDKTIATKYDTDTITERINNTRLIIEANLHDTVPFWSDTTSTIATKTDVANAGGGTSYDSVHIYNYVDSLGTIIDEQGDRITQNENDISNLYDLIVALGGDVPPRYDSAEVGGYADNIVNIYLGGNTPHQDSIPSNLDFTVTEDAVGVGVDSVAIHNDSLLLFLVADISESTTVLSSYVPGDTVLQDSSGNKSTGWTNKVVDNLVVGTTVYTDDFNSYSNGTALAGQGNWITGVGTITCNGTGIYPNSAGIQIIPFDAPVALGDDQFAEMTMAGSSSRYLGTGVRMNLTNGGNGYVYYHSGSNSALAKIEDGVLTEMGVNGSAGDPITLRLEVVGSTISCYLDDVLDSGLTNTVDGTFTDTDFTTGFTAVFGNNDSGTLTGDNFSTGNK